MDFNKKGGRSDIDNAPSNTAFFLRKLVSGCFGLAIALPVCAGTMGEVAPNQLNWTATGSLGYTVYEDMYRGDGGTAIGRLALGRELYRTSGMTLGLEVGVQNGNTMRYFPSQYIVDTLGGLPIRTTAKPMLDVLATLTTASMGTTPFFGVLKGGAAYRRWQFDDRNSINDLSKFAGEVQAGLGYTISEKTNLSLVYQGIYGSSPDFHLNVAAETGHVDNIPMQHGVLLSFTVAL
ncbi:hypothetical protein [uncultured Legionella sp.]|uniref:hypothetical protein n=1 Tax=uncultured Legionella sp. TaxID=210934 RepID=UPI00261B12B4|nr:hypothetical protein [uncultured Legionella sp.]